MTFKQGLLTKIDEKNNKITVVDIPTEADGCDQILETQDIHYDALVICTGASYSSPWRSGDNEW